MTLGDEGITGTSAEKREDFQRLLADCRRGLIDRVLVKSISRFARNTKECLEVIRELKNLGIGVCFEKENIDTSTMSGEMMTTLFASFAQAESESISGNMRWSYQRRMRDGTYLPSSVPYGYRICDRQIVIDEEQAAVVRRIFKDYLAGINMAEIAAALNHAGVQKRKENPTVIWHKASIRYILTNERYTGDSLWQKTYLSLCWGHLPRRRVRASVPMSDGASDRPCGKVRSQSSITGYTLMKKGRMANPRLFQNRPRSSGQSMHST